MKDILRKAMCALFGVVIALGVGAAPAQAAETGYGKTLDLTGLAAGETVHVYKLMSYGDDYNTYVYDNTNSNGFDKFLDSKRGDKSKDEYLKGLSSTEVAEVLDRFLYSNYDKPTATDYTVSGTEQSISLEPGYYMFTVSTTGSESNMYKPFSAFVKVNGNSSTILAGSMTQASSDAKVTVAMKSEQGPTIDKKVMRANGTDMASTWKNTKTVAMGEEITYRIAVTIPNWQDVQYPGLTLMDTLVNQEYVSGSVQIKSDEGDAATSYKPTGDLSSGAITEDTIGTYTNGTQNVSFAIDYSKLEANHTYYVTYKTKVMSDITGTTDAGNMAATNTAKLQYNTGQATTSTTTESTTSLYTYAAKLTKQDLDGKLLAGAGFTIYSDAACTTPITFEKVSTGTNTWYYRQSASGTVTEITADGDGDYLLIKGLDPAKDYYYKETTTPKGYYAPSGAFKLDLASQMTADDATEHSGSLSSDSSVTATATADSALVSGSVNATNANQFDIVVKNSSTPSLPTTGGMGTVIFTVAGIALMLAAAGAFVVLRRRRQQ